MTRINLVDPTLLSDQHLMAEYRELPMVPAALNRALRTKTTHDIIKSIPFYFTLNTGHVRFFYNKLTYLQDRYERLQEELRRRKYDIDPERVFNKFTFPAIFYGQYTPTDTAYDIITKRIKEKLNMKPGWYRYYGKVIEGRIGKDTNIVAGYINSIRYEHYQFSNVIMFSTYLFDNYGVVQINDPEQKNHFVYEIVDEKKFLLAHMKYTRHE